VIPGRCYADDRSRTPPGPLSTLLYPVDGQVGPQHSANSCRPWSPPGRPSRNTWANSLPPMAPLELTLAAPLLRPLGQPDLRSWLRPPSGLS
jgi:hypothetical protein